MIFDCHMHLGDFPLFNVSLDEPGLDELVASCGLDKAIVFHPDNSLVQRAIADRPQIFGLVWANPRELDCAQTVESYLNDPNFRGIKLHPLLDGYHPNDPMVHPLADLAAERGLPMLIHTGHPIFTLPWSVEELAQAKPGTKVIMGHMGHGNIIYINAAIDAAERRPNVYLETSGMPMHAKIAEAVNRVGADRVLYGSDAPFHHPEVEILKVKLSGIKQSEMTMVLGMNAERIFFGDNNSS
jgi:predicted TIM-barrel fold metal-dependent hydrolase